MIVRTERDRAIWREGILRSQLNAANERVRKLEEALRRAQQDINWMLNSEKFLNGWVFDYIDEVLEKKS